MTLDSNIFHISMRNQHQVQLTEAQHLLRGDMFCKQAVMLPHDIVSTLYHHSPEVFFPVFTGEPGRLQKYWMENMDLYESLNMPDLDAWRIRYCWGQTI